MLAVLSAAAVMAAAAPFPHSPAPGLLDNSCRHSIERARFGPAPAVLGSVKVALLHSLSDLPDADEEILVNRTVQGCPAPVIVVREVSSPASGRR